MLSTTTIDQVRDLPIEQVIGQYITLKNAGANYKACCPLHNEKSPSFYVTPAKNTFHCFGCGAGSSGIDFVMLHDSLPFIEAVKSIASQHGIAIEETSVKGKTPEQIDEEQEMYDWVQRAQVKYRTALVERESVVRYLFGRNFTRETIIEWQFGVVPDWRVITGDLITAGKFEIGESAGLVKKKDGHQWDVMNHRITIPIHNTQGQIIGFAGRLHAELDIKKLADGPKYMNPPETPLYEKSKTLFGLYQAIQKKAFKVHGMAVLVEGYTDVIKMHQRGWNNAVATCGTALTPNQAKLLKRFTDTVLILRDGDHAGLKAIKKDVPILVEAGFTVLVCELPNRKVLVSRTERIDYELMNHKAQLILKFCPWQFIDYKFVEISEDPDTFFDQSFEYIVGVLSNYRDGIEYLTDQWFANTSGSIPATAKAIQDCTELLSLVTNMVQRDQYIKVICKKYNQKTTDFTKQISKVIQERADEAEERQRASMPDDPNNGLPAWVNLKELERDGFIQLAKDTEGYRAGIYFQNVKYRNLYNVTNFVMRPLFHIYEQYNNRRLIELEGEGGNVVVELPNNTIAAQSQFETEMIAKGNFFCNEQFTKSEFKRLTGWMLRSMPKAYELKTLGWQPEDFFAYSNAVFYNGNLVQYDELGMIKIDDKHYMSMGNSKMRKDERQTDNPYENDLFLKYVAPREGIDFEKWASMFNVAYGDHGPFGIAFVLLTLFKDIVTPVGKMPLLYCYGQKGSGKSAMAESISWLFFSGKNSEKNLIQGFNLNPGQSTQFSLYNRLERFRNCPTLMNEYDENVIEPWKIGAMKAAYDGEGREVGVGESGKRKVTRIQKPQGTIILVGQYFGLRDDGAVASRSIPCSFSLERVKALTPEQIKTFNLLRKEEQDGICFLLTDLLKLRPELQKTLAVNFANIQGNVMERMRLNGFRIEARLISNYSLILACTKSVLDAGLKLPYTYQQFYDQALLRMISHNQLLKDNSIVGMFWKSVEVMFDKSILISGVHLKIEYFPNGLRIGSGTNIERMEVGDNEVLLIRFDNVYDEYAKYQRERGNAVQNSKTVLGYLTEQTYFYGAVPVYGFTDKRTSAYAFNYSAMKEMGIVLEKISQQTNTPSVINPAPSAPDNAGKQDDLPF